MTIRIVQRTTANVARQAVRAIEVHPDLELVSRRIRTYADLSLIGPRGRLQAF